MWVVDVSLKASLVHPGLAITEGAHLPAQRQGVI
jgi:hypothetical protein